MSRFSGSRGLTTCPLVAMLLLLLGTGACDRPAELRTKSDPPAEPSQVPFHDSDNSANGRSESPSAPENGPKLEPNLPFHDPQNLPAGTLLTVVLKTPISTRDPATGRTFEAVVDQPVVIEGSKLIPRGAIVSGRVESARTSSLKRNRGYVRLKLESIHLAGVSLPIQTASLFVGESPKNLERAPRSGTASNGEASPAQTFSSGPSPAVIRVEKGRRLTFRLTEAVYVAASERSRIDH